MDTDTVIDGEGCVAYLVDSKPTTRKQLGAGEQLADKPPHTHIHTMPYISTSTS